MALLLLHTTPDPVVLAHWATRKHWLSSDGDFGYALHALLAQAFEGQPPTPYRYMNEQGLLAYSNSEESELRKRAEAAPPEVRLALGLQHLRLRPFPTEWPAGKRLGFDVLIRPIIRTTAGKERDLYQYRMEKCSVDRAADKSSREAIYCEWLEQRLAQNGAAQLVEAAMHKFTLRKVIRRPQRHELNHTRTPSGVIGPNAVFRGELVVRDPSAFAHLLARGVGRHRAFGYGMVLLRPARGEL